MSADLDDFDAPPPPRPRRPRAKPGEKATSARRSAPSRSGRLWTFLRRYPLELMIAGALSASVGAVAYNALALQTSRHPAPFFGSGGKVDGPTPLPPSRPSLAAPAVPSPAPLASAPAPSAPAAAAPMAPPPQRTASRDSIGDLIRSAETPAAAPRAAPARPAAVPAAVPAAAPAPAAPAARDPIADLIRLGGGAPPAPPALVGKPDATRTVSAGQRALAKLGYISAKPDGVMGPGTRQAIERFERERRLPVTGEFSGRTARELSTLSGIAVE